MFPSIIDAVGKTPVVKLQHIGSSANVDILAKLEFLNPSGSTKDRAIRRAVRIAEQKGLLKKGGVIVDSSSGNFAIAMSALGASRGYKVICVVDPNLTESAKCLIESLGGNLEFVNEPDDTGSYLRSRIARRNKLLKTIPGAWSPNQYVNKACVEAHSLETGKEIIESVERCLDVLVIPVGTGCTIAGCAQAVKEHIPNVRVVAVDAVGSQIFDNFKYKRKQVGLGSSYNALELENLDLNVIDEVRLISDTEAFVAARTLAFKEGILAGGSSGTALFAALTMVDTLKNGSRILVLFPDRLERYLGQFNCANWMKKNQFPLNRDLDFLQSKVDAWIQNAQLLEGPGQIPVRKSII